MTPRHKLELRRSQIRARLGEISDLETDAVTDEVRAERDNLMTEIRTSEPQLQAAILAEETEARHRGDQATGDGEGAEMRSLIDRARLSGYVGALLEKRTLAGAEAELQGALELRTPEQGGLVIPWEVLDPGPPVEQRADTATALTATSGVGTAQDTIIQRVFARTAAQFIGVRMSSVGIGQHSYPIITVGQTPALVTAGTEHDATAATIGAKTLEPKRLTARYVIRLTDVARLQGYEEALRQDLNGAMSEQLDLFILTGDDAIAPQWSGFFDALTDPNAPGAVASYQTFLQAYGDGVDGRYANDLAQVRLLVGAKTYGLAASVVQTGSGMTAIQYSQAATGGMMASALVPAPASDVQQAILAKTGPGAMDNAVCNTWPGMELIYDPYSRASRGEISLTAVSIVDCAILRTAGYAQVAFQLA